MSVSTSSSIEQLSINTIRTLSMDAVEKAVSGHPGTPMALAPVTYTLWNQFLKYDPAAPLWPTRDRFVLSCGHASMLLYSMIHLSGIKKLDPAGKVLDEASIKLEDIKNFRQLHSPCAGHPEYGYAAGIETTTGPLGQGCGNSVGMAITSRWLSGRFGKPGFEDLFDWNVYALCSDGDLMEGVANEAASIAGHLKLSNLCWIYDDNKITIEGETDLAFNEDVATRFEGLGWNAIMVDDANDTGAIARAIRSFQATNDKPTLIIVRSIIGFGSPNKANSHSAHGAALGKEEIKLTKAAYGWPVDQDFLVPPEVPTHFAEGIGARGKEEHANWDKRFAAYEKAFPQEAATLKSMWKKELPVGWDKDIPVFGVKDSLATRVSSGKVLNAVAKNVPWLIGGSADLAPSTMTMLEFDGAGHFEPHSYGGRNFHFGIREHGMAAAANGMALCGVRPYIATFFVFTDYLRPSLRLSAIMHQPVLYVMTHDSIGLGEDGPTHQPVEHLAACRAIPRVVVMRPGDANEVSECYRTLMKINDRPVVLVLSRQKAATLDRTKYAPAAGTAKGAYVLSDAANGKPEVILMGTGTELQIAVAAGEKLAAEGIAVRVVSFPSWQLFEQQDKAYRESVLPPGVTARVAVEAGIRQGWDRYIGSEGAFVGMTDFGASAPDSVLYKHFGLTAEKVAEAAKQQLGK